MNINEEMRNIIINEEKEWIENEESNEMAWARNSWKEMTNNILY